VRAWLVLHVLAAIGGMGPEMAFAVMGPAARRRGRVAASAVAEAVATARTRIVCPFLALQVASGVALILIERRSILHEAWLGVSLLLYAVAIALVALVLAPGSGALRRALDAGAEPSDPALRPLLARQAAAGGVAGALLVAVAVLMVWKPGA
jgi:hypothetical protein